ncbi:Homeobox-like_domain superfamily [Hexamita inflata]|uniref:Homeobox-like domain superfamily n=1 Tax=Hexamita inflata TaxID=28002 RepID=A0AA86QGA9_9EUKA|nr:Homeobox-like domain superfamily [Hexamita inflata]
MNDLLRYFGVRVERSQWSFRDDKILLLRVKQFGTNNCKLLQFEGKSEKQIYFRLRYLKQIHSKKANEQRARNIYRDWFEYFEQ